ncbi:hypothetical protein AKJ56_00960 [candidate division MSBL1 archaeon SCGC-AAA382N08]|uniref:Uncharacterized protein n=1 Tax=candidate division MSBL1 archaeon SCGC-AAA382N08 TaxID=1698285 RepID=A0A133VQ23_9EURY|nr:hypothetical protein AKJ56_00960 [candidate division MSBL1 archaeon SCGC-AAA382N08]
MHVNLPRGKQKIIDDENNLAGVDRTTQSLRNVTLEESMIHEGKHFSYVDFQESVGSGTNIDILLSVPDVDIVPHLRFIVYSSAGVKVYLYKQTDFNNNGTPITPTNDNQNSSNISVMDVSKGNTINNIGTELLKYRSGAKKETGIIERNYKIVLAKNTNYLLRITSADTSNNISWDIQWDEHYSGQATEYISLGMDASESQSTAESVILQMSDITSNISESQSTAESVTISVI